MRTRIDYWSGEEPTATDWAYLAGLIDGEGSVAISHRKDGSHIRNGTRTYYHSDNSYQCHITISNTDFKMIDWVRYTFKGCVYFSRPREGNRVPQYTVAWQANDMVEWVLKNTLPYMLTKYEVAEVILRFLSTPKLERELRALLHDEFYTLKATIRAEKKEMTHE